MSAAAQGGTESTAIKFPGFINGTAELAAVNIDAEQTINLYPERLDGTDLLWLRKRPGLATFATCGVGPVRALFHQDGRVFCVSANRFYELFSDGTATDYGPVNTDSRPAFIVSNGQIGSQLLIVSGGSGYIFDLNANTLSSAIAAAGFPANALSCVFADSYFIALFNGYPKFAFSGLADGTAWDALDVAQKSQTSDNLLAMVYDHKELWLIGSKTIEIWVDTGDTNNPWSPQPILIECGLAAQDSICKGDDSIFWLKSGEFGALTVMRAQGYTPVRISTHSLERELKSYTRTDDAYAFFYEDDGHGFYVLTFPTDGITWAYDVRTQSWAQRGYWNSGLATYEADLARCHCWVPSWKKHLVGSRIDGTVYTMSTTLLDDDGDEIRWLRRAPLVVDEQKLTFISRLELGIKVGVGTGSGQGTDPMMFMRISRDGGNTWSSEKYAALGPLAQHSRKVYWTRLGSARRWVVEVAGTDPVFIGIYDAYLDATPGAH